ncbi:hypothetical protein [Parendozoicomonas haliclonae]|uniref:Uncharacterized protein n=1 Tax=Parendozoicomonas haliclonae TaxID=1960125 RepID=A0A1X7AI08_9GAMM|nr:hypothetical protein [Parendozoicomonas haliclonae]SMA43982.1 hypothetical protein EHSB41UT_01705 [Parendozoicomonas haliclonae]
MKQYLISSLTTLTLAFSTSLWATDPCPANKDAAANLLGELTETQASNWLDEAGGNIYNLNPLSAIYAGNHPIDNQDYHYICVRDDGPHHYTLSCRAEIGPSDATVYDCTSKDQ